MNTKITPNNAILSAWAVTNHAEQIFWEYQKDILKTLAKQHKIMLDDPEGGEKHYDPDKKINKEVVVLDKSISRLWALLKFFKREKYLKKLLKTEWISHFEKLWKDNLSAESYQFCKDMYEKYNIVVLADNKVLDYLGRILWTVYNGGSLGKFSIVRDWTSVEKWPGRIKHEWIHGKQGWIRKWFPSLVSLLKGRRKLNWLVPWKMDYATDNQISDWETYMNQYKKDPIKDIKPYEFKKYKNKENRFDAVKNHLQTDIIDLKNEIEELKKKKADIESGKIQVDKSDTKFTKEEWIANIKYLLEQKEDNLISMEDLQSKHYDTADWHQFITFGEEDGYLYKETPEKRQTNFQSDESLRKQLPIDMFITHYGNKKDNYKAWVEMYSLHKDKVIEIMEAYIKDKSKRKLKRRMKKLFKEIG